MADIRKINPVIIVLIYIMVFVFTILAVYPILWTIIQSFKTTQDYMLNSKLALPEEWYWQNYRQTWNSGRPLDIRFEWMIGNSIFYTAVTVFAQIILSFMAGFAFAKLPSKLTPFIHGSFIIGILLTLQSIMIPLFLMVNAAGLYNTRLGVLIPYIGLALPFGVYLSTEYIKAIPDSVVESARIDGARYFRIFTSIIMPMAAPVAVTVAILGVTRTWNEFMLINILVSSNALKSLPVGIQTFSGQLASDFGKLFSSLVIGMLPMVIFYFIFRKQITKGVSAGAVKG
ncbi:MAG: carbohydrate ABC transporter permease [Treponema sp.]|nr:carbohydrate ABC transporter permease [Treponema sp.]